MADICVVHLVRAKNGIQPFRNFLESYLKYDSGADHDLLIIFKGFIGTNGTGQYTQLLKEISFKAIHMHDFGFDIRSFFLAVNKINKKYFCFLNSFSTIRGREWLSKLNRNLTQNGIGLVGATGSYESHYSNFLIEQKSIGFAKTQLARRLVHFFAKMKYEYYFDPFPNYHIRTNGFMISQDVMRKIRHGIILSKMDAHRFESGKRSLTKQVLQMNLGVRVIGKNGEDYRMEDWCRSDTFRQGDQNNLLIADNQTNAYLDAGADLKRKLSGYAWGKGTYGMSRKA
jgi:hypothetical protein